jgi:uncharacterized membrane protein YdfJ with MMPL/SSD domain
VPIISFAFLFGLSMDYEVFILTRMREEYDRSGSTNAAVLGALSSAALPSDTGSHGIRLGARRPDPECC